VGIIDMDEFAFWINTTLARFLRQLTPAKQQVCLPWIIFGSSNLTVQPACVTEANVRRRGNVEREGKCFMRTRRILSAEIHRTVMHNETYHRRGEGCVCGDGRRCNCCGHTGPSPAFACHSSLSPLRSSQASTPHLRLHHYISQSREHMLARSSVGEADLYKRTRSDSYWNRIEALSNGVLDFSLAKRAVCRAGASTDKGRRSDRSRDIRHGIENAAAAV